jgi:hypothetical protein
MKRIFQHNINLISNIEKMVYQFRIQNYDFALRSASECINVFSTYLNILLEQQRYFNENYIIIDQAIITEMLTELLNAQENQDYILLSDLYELKFLPFLYQLQEIIIYNSDITMDDAFLETVEVMNQTHPELTTLLINQAKHPSLQIQHCEIEYTASGLKTIVIQKEHSKKIYMHSNRSASFEAFLLANSWYTEEKSIYLVYGLGCGYHIQELLNLDSNIKIEVYEGDLQIIYLAAANDGFVNILRSQRVSIIHDPEYKKLMERLQEMTDDMEFVIHHPSLYNIKNQAVRTSLEEYFIHYSSIKNQSRLLNSNFHKNLKNYDNFVDVLVSKFTGKDLYIIAAGPSLDKNFLELKNLNRDDSIILATGTVFRKLLRANIIPDYVIVTDANPRVYKQISQLEQQTVPMLFLSTAYFGFAEKYSGKKYMICQEGYPKAEEFAKKHNHHSFQTGGSVSTTALDLGIYFGCKRIIFLGLDLAYTNDLVHASDTSRRKLQDIEHLIQISDIYGKPVYTTKVLNIYRKWIEDRIKGISSIELIDATEGGAKIEGMKIANLKQVITG